jgi:SAM-dependent methyltransferase
MTVVSTVFGEVAALYDEARPPHSPRIGDLVLAYAGAAGGAAALEIGAGTGSATALFVGRGFPITCVEPDARMARRLVARFPGVAVAASTFEDWTPPPEGFFLAYAALSWHWLDPLTRVDRAVRALWVGGALAVIGCRLTIRDPAIAARIAQALSDAGVPTGARPPLREWVVPELQDCPQVTDVAVEAITEPLSWSAERYVAFVRTLSPFRTLPAAGQARVVEALGDAIDGEVALDRETSVVLARRSR